MKKNKILIALFLVAGGCSSSSPRNDAEAKNKATANQVEAANKNSTGDVSLDDGEAAPKGPEAATPVGSEASDKDLYDKFNKARASKNYKAAVDAGGEVLARNPNDVKVINALAVLAIDQSKYDLARLLLGKVLEKDPNNGAAFNNLGIVELKEDNLRLALIQFKRATEVDPHNRSAHANLGTIYLQYRNYPNAAAQLDAAVTDGDQSPATLSNYGFAMTGAGDYPKAQAAYEKALAKEPSNINIMFNYASLLVQHTNDKKGGIKILNKIKFIAREPAMLNKVDALLKIAENAPSKSAAVKGDLD